MTSFIAIYFIAYGAVALVHIELQLLLSYLEYRRHRAQGYRRATPSVTVVIPAYNEDPALLHRCLLSIDRQAYPDFEAIVVDDGSLNVAELLPVHDEFSSGRFCVVRQPDNGGKRRSQDVVFGLALGEVVITVDSDTVLLPDAIRTIVRRFEDPKVGAVTGNVEVINKRKNLLTRLIACRYSTACNQERAAQSYFGVVMCASGPFSAYRRSIIERVRESYINQRFLGRPCTFGDDRHLTNLVLGLGYDVVYDSQAVASTHVPDRLRGYLRQQTRWNRSFYRELLRTAKLVVTRNAYMVLDLGLQTLMPFAQLVAIGLTAYAAATDPSTVAQYSAIIVGVGLVRALCGMFQTRQAGVLLFVTYCVLDAFLLIPIQLYALATMRRVDWGTREAEGDSAQDAARRAILHARSDEGRVEAETAWARDVQRTVAEGENFLLHWQPVRNLWNGELTHAEVLLRLRHDGHILPPVDFLSIARRHGLTVMVDERVARDTIALLAQSNPAQPLRLEVNISAESLHDPRLTNLIGAQLAQNRVSPRKLVLAIAERDVLREPGAAAAFARRVRSLGCLVALDDFGEASEAGDEGASERLLRELPLDYAKLTGSIVRRLPYSSDAREALRRLLALTRARGVETIAVHVGDEETVRVLEQERVDYAQGFHIGAPAPVARSLAEIVEQAAQRQATLDV